MAKPKKTRSNVSVSRSTEASAENSDAPQQVDAQLLEKNKQLEQRIGELEAQVNTAEINIKIARKDVSIAEARVVVLEKDLKARKGMMSELVTSLDTSDLANEALRKQNKALQLKANTVTTIFSEFPKFNDMSQIPAGHVDKLTQRISDASLQDTKKFIANLKDDQKSLALHLITNDNVAPVRALAIAKFVSH